MEYPSLPLVDFWQIPPSLLTVYVECERPLSVILVTGKSEVTQRIEIVEVVLEIVIEKPPDEKVGLQNLLKKSSVKKIRQQGLLK